MQKERVIKIDRLIPFLAILAVFINSASASLGGLGVLDQQSTDCQTTTQVCGNDYKTYFNSCIAQQAGVSVLYEGECKVCSTVRVKDCLNYANCEVTTTTFNLFGFIPITRKVCTAKKASSTGEGTSNIGFRLASWECSDLSSLTAGDSTSCKSWERWYGYAEGYCAGKCSDSTAKCGVDSFSVSEQCSLTSQPVCGNGICESGETTTNCPHDCKTASKCGNGICDSGETTTNCPQDCKAASQCGDGIKDSNEECDGNDFGTTSKDCKIFDSKYSSGSLKCTSCKIDTSDCKTASKCGNGICDSGETTTNCPQDCHISPMTVSISASPSEVLPGQSATLIWSSTGATSCFASGDWSGDKPTSGALAITQGNGAQTNRYYLTCTGSKGSVTNEAYVIFTSKPLPVSISISPSTTLAPGTPFTLTWSASNSNGATQCDPFASYPYGTASSWVLSGMQKPSSGSWSGQADVTGEYGIQCHNGPYSGSQDHSAAVLLTVAPSGPPPTISSATYESNGLTIKGTGFVGSNVVKFGSLTFVNGVGANANSNTANQIFTVFTANIGTYDVSVSNANSVSNTVQVTVGNAQPQQPGPIPDPSTAQFIVKAAWGSGADMPALQGTIPTYLNGDYIIFVWGSLLQKGVVFDFYKSDGAIQTFSDLPAIATADSLDQACPPFSFGEAQGVGKCATAYYLSFGPTGTPDTSLFRARNPDGSVSNFIKLDLHASGSYASNPFIIGATVDGVYGTMGVAAAATQDQSHSIDVYGMNFKSGDSVVLENLCTFPNVETCGPLNRATLPVTYLSPGHVKFTFTPLGWGKACASGFCGLQYKFQVVKDPALAFSNDNMPYNVGLIASYPAGTSLLNVQKSVTPISGHIGTNFKFCNQAGLRDGYLVMTAQNGVRTIVKTQPAESNCETFTMGSSITADQGGMTGDPFYPKTFTVVPGFYVFDVWYRYTESATSITGLPQDHWQIRITH